MASKMPPVAPGTRFSFSGLMKGLATGGWLRSRLENDWPLAGFGAGSGVGSGSRIRGAADWVADGETRRSGISPRGPNTVTACVLQQIQLLAHRGKRRVRTVLTEGVVLRDSQASGAWMGGTADSSTAFATFLVPCRPIQRAASPPPVE